MFLKKKDFGGSKYDFIIAGLGNPGAKYEMTRHNAGFLAMDLLSIEEGVDIKRLKHHALCADMTVEGKKCLVMKPQTMMNLSGVCISFFFKRFNYIDNFINIFRCFWVNRCFFEI